jgi:hypothetical protein
MDVEYVQTVRDVIAFNVYHHQNRPWWRRHMRWWLGCLIFCGIALVSWLRDSRPEAHSSTSFWIGFVGVSAAGASLWTAYCLLYWRRIIAEQVKRFVKRPENKRMLGWHSCSIGPEGVTATTKDTKTLILWSGVNDIVSTSDHLFMYVTKQNAIIVPRQPFASEQDFRRFAAAAQQFRNSAMDSQPERIRSRRRVTPEADTNIMPGEHADI